MSVTETPWRAKAGWGTVLRYLGPLGFGAACMWAVAQSVTPGAFDGLGTSLHDLAPWQWIGAALATGLSFWALGRYDAVLHQHLRTGCVPKQAALSGAAAIAIGQTVGMGVLSGALVRWRLLPGLTFLQATALAAGVAVTFLIGLALCLGVTGLFLPLPALPTALCIGVILSFTIIIFATVLHPEFHLLGRRMCLPAPRAMMRIAVLTAVDTSAAALALWVLLPLGTGVGFHLLLPAYMLALGAGVVSGAPGGVGPFELTLLTVLPSGADVDLLCGLVAFRLVYYAAPALISAVILMRPFAPGARPTPLECPVGERELTGHGRAEIGLSRQRGTSILAKGASRLPVLRPGHSLCALFGPLRGPDRAALDMLASSARHEARTPLVYKADAALAAKARKWGWHALHVADDIVIDLTGFRLEGRAFRQIRRKLRQAQKAGVQTSQSHTHPWGVLRQIDQDWQARHGAARGVTMGRFCPVYLSHQRVFVARRDGQIIAFASFHENGNGLCLDLMRMQDNVPDGTMQMLIVQAIDTARDAGLIELSLAALPPCEGPVGWLAARCAHNGLEQFKLAFSPRRVPRYALGRSRLGLWMGLLDLWLAIRCNSNSAQEEHEDYEFARAGEMWDTAT